MAVLVDTNILVDIAVRDETWFGWSRRRLASADAPLVINPVIYAEFSVRYQTPEEVEYLLPDDHFHRENLPWMAAFAAGAAFRKYRQSGGGRDCVLPDFLIGAHAAVRGYKILTRDSKGYRSYFPTVELITPETHP
jgi:hypothetical protein